MNKTTLFAFILLLVSALFLSNSLAQDNPQWQLPDGATARFGKGWISGLEYSPDGTRLAVSSPIGIWLYDTTTLQEVGLLTGHTETVSTIAYSPDGSMLASGSWDDTIRLWDTATGETIKTLIGHEEGILSIAFSPDGKTVVSGSYDDTVRLWDVDTGENTQTLTEH